ncbi:hypothetical protein GE300_11375 [Rhodobacteraceae bacterium 2CG4]|uniref:DUF985 domain-containing protein n=1 Tax=Halovulum marinum TaxID=2662447 RepID=A0A6L5Z2H2_9RHOB|nr:cupin domain-containing protein [Halovulum marinum]MSU90212.1 hypothetical protein [Halovulum marinum]
MDTRELIDRRKPEPAPHPEGGWHRESWRAAAAPGTRPAGLPIYHLLEAGQRSHWPRLDSAEAGHFHAGSALRLEMASGSAAPPETHLPGPGSGRAARLVAGGAKPRRMDAGRMRRSRPAPKPAVRDRPPGPPPRTAGSRPPPARKVSPPPARPRWTRAGPGDMNGPFRRRDAPCPTPSRRSCI